MVSPSLANKDLDEHVPRLEDMLCTHLDDTSDLMFEFDTSTLEEWVEKDGDLEWILGEYGLSSELEIAKHLSGFEIVTDGERGKVQPIPWQPSLGDYETIRGERAVRYRTTDELPF